MHATFRPSVLLAARNQHSVALEPARSGDALQRVEARRALP
jgi:hypothetical protein